MTSEIAAAILLRTYPGPAKKYKSNRQGVAGRFEDESARKTIEVNLELIAYYDTIIRCDAVSKPETDERHRRAQTSHPDLLAFDLTPRPAPNIDSG